MLDLIILYCFTPFVLSVNWDKIIFSSMKALLLASQISLINLIASLLNVSNHKGVFLCLILLLPHIGSSRIDRTSLVCNLLLKVTQDFIASL